MPATVEVTATPTQGVYMELLWDVVPDPGEEPDDTQYAADLDLHLAHPSANMLDIDDDGQPDHEIDTQHTNPVDYWLSFAQY